MAKNISFIHLSDIHFNKFSGDPYDLDADLRREILRDIQENAEKAIGKPEGILVCGDIAFSGKKEEYDSADIFLKEICEKLEISETSVYCVPGNHDVDQEVLKSSSVFVDLQFAVENAPDLDGKLAESFRDSERRVFLFKHIHDYNKFAGKFDCQLNKDEKKPNWAADFTLNDKSILRIVGLNSIIISSHLSRQNRNVLFLAT